MWNETVPVPKHDASNACRCVHKKDSTFNMFALEGANEYLQAMTALLPSSNWLGGRVWPRAGLYIIAKRKIPYIAMNGADWDPRMTRLLLEE
jgi:hypothetical protein